jgi:methionyl-tRNA formyltransferase
MRILFLGNNRVGWQVLRWLKEHKEHVAGLVIHPSEHQKYGKEIVEVSGLDSSRIFDGSQLRRPEALEKIRALKPDIGLSVFFRYILKPELLNLFPLGCINLHPAFLPYNRGGYPNVWSIIEGAPIGATLHYIDAGIDTGDIIAQRQISVDPVDTGETLYRKLECLCIDLFIETWPLVKTGQSPRIPQGEQIGTYHRDRDVEQIDRIDLDRTYPARELINILRARTFPPYPGAYFVHEGRKIYVRVQLLREEEL